MDLRRQLAVLRAWLPLLVASVLLAGGAAFLVSGLLPKVYEGNATLIVGQSLSAVNPDYNALLASQRLSQTYASVATARPVLDGVIKQLSLQETTDQLRTRVSADAPANNTLIIITARDADPARAAAIANALAGQLIATSPAIQGRQTDVQQAVTDDLKATRAEIQSTQAEIQRLAGLPSRTAAQEQQLQTLQSGLNTLRSTYATLVSDSSNSSSNLLTVVEPAAVPISPASPKPLLNTLLAAIVGLLIAIGIAFLAEYLDDTLKDSDDVEEVAGLPTLGAIMRMKGDESRSEIYRLASILYPRSAAAEAYRTLRTNIEFAAVDEPVRTLLVTSAIPGEGKTTTAANLAVVFAQAGKRVLLVDADLRKPGAHRIFDLPNAHGLTTLLRNDEVSLEAIAHTTEQATLQVLTTGPLPPNPAELLGSQRMRTILDRLLVGHDLVILDSPPLQAVTDSAVMASYLDGTLLVVDAARTRRGAVRQGREALAKADARVVGVALNRLSERSYSDYYHYYGDYHYGDYHGSQEEKGREPRERRERTPNVVGK